MFDDCIRPRDIVYLKSGSPELIVMACNEDTAWVCWFDEDEYILREVSFPIVCLEKVYE